MLQSQVLSLAEHRVQACAFPLGMACHRVLHTELCTQKKYNLTSCCALQA